MAKGISPPDPFVLNDAFAIGLNVLPYRKTAGLAVRSQGYNSSLKNLVLIGAGQSNSTSLTPTLYTPPHSSAIDQLNIYDGGSYEIAGPLLGTQYSPNSFGPGNVLAEVAENAIVGGFDRVILVPVGIAGTTAVDWATGSLTDRIPVAMRRLESRGYVPVATGLSFAISWWEGETAGATGMSAPTWTAAMNAILANAQAAGFAGRFFVNRETWGSGSVYSTIQNAQTAIVDNVNFFSGGNMDSLNSSNRQGDNTHWNDTGRAAAAALAWAAMHASGAPY